MANLLLRKDSICRTCLREAINSTSLISKMENDDRTVNEVLSSITSFDITISEKYPIKICNECFIMIRKTDEFKKRCIQSETLLKNEYLNYKLLVDDFVKQDIISSSSSSPPFQTLMLDENNVLNRKSASLQSADYEMPLIDEYPLSNTTDTLNIDDMNIIKQERDDFLQEDIEDLANSILIDKMQLPPISPAACSLKVISCECGRECGNITQLKSHFNECKHENVSNTRNDSICGVCKLEFANLDLLKTHLDKHKNEQNVCEFDQNLTNNVNGNKYENNQLEAHDINEESGSSNIFVLDTPVMKQIKNERDPNTLFIPKNELYEMQKSVSISCPHCTWALPDLKTYKKHIEKHKKYMQKKKFQCSMCARKFVTRKLLIAHLNLHDIKNSQKFECKTCKREFKHQAHLENHIESAHTKIKGFKCDTCSKSFSNQESLELHKHQHTNSRKYQCNVCSKTFAVHSVLSEHLRTHTGEKPFLCSFCGRGFTQKTNLAQHIRRHQGLKPFKCSSCDRSFVSKGELDAHTRKHTGKHPFICDECGNSFTTSSSLTKHRRIHTGEKRYACDLCTMRFTALGTLKNHRRTHTGEKPYQCSLCEKAFIQRQDLVGHIRCHTGEKPFTCVSCGLRFRKSSALTLHLRTHGNDMLVRL